MRIPSRLILIAGSAATVALLMRSAAAQHPGGGPPPPPPVTVATIQATQVPVSFDYSAITDASKKVEIRARVQGYIETRDFEEGAFVKKGSLLYTIDPRTFQADKEIAAAQVEQAEAEKKLAEQELKRMKSVTLPGAVAASEVEKQEAAVSNAAASLRLAKAQLAKSALELSFTRVEAPMDGLIGKALKEIGSLVDTGQNSLLATMYKITPIYVSMSVSEKEYLAWRSDQESGALVLANGDQPYVEITLNDKTTYGERGTLNFLSPQLNTETGSYELRAEFANADNKLRPGQYVKAHIRGWSRPGSISVPQRAVTQSPLGPFVYVVGGDDIAQQRNIELGEWTGDNWIVKSGLSPGERIIVEGLTKVQPGGKVNPTAPAPGESGAKSN